MRGSSEFHAWGDSNLYLRRAGDSLTLSIEHRAAPSASGISLALLDDGRSLALHIAQARPAEPTPATAAERIEKALESSSSPPVGLAALRDACRMRTQSVSSALGLLVQQGRVAKTADGYVLARR